jgi:hypothetical protein
VDRELEELRTVEIETRVAIRARGTCFRGLPAYRDRRQSKGNHFAGRLVAATRAGGSAMKLY